MSTTPCSTVTPRLQEILSYYPSDNPGTLTNLARLFMHGRLAGTGRLVILPLQVDKEPRTGWFPSGNCRGARSTFPDGD